MSALLELGEARSLGGMGYSIGDFAPSVPLEIKPCAYEKQKSWLQKKSSRSTTLALLLICAHGWTDHCWIVVMATRKRRDGEQPAERFAKVVHARRPRVGQFHP